MNIPADGLQFREIIHFKSRRNTVKLIQTEQGCAVLKEYGDENTWTREQMIYRLLQGSPLPHAEIIAVYPRKILLTQLPGRVLTTLLCQQEADGVICWTVWDRLVQWLTDFHRETGFVITDPNLRNFLYDEQTQTLYGLDFEECAEGSMTRTAALLAAYIRHDTPENTPIKKEIADHIRQKFSSGLGIPVEELLEEENIQEAMLLHRRRNKK